MGHILNMWTTMFTFSRSKTTERDQTLILLNRMDLQHYDYDTGKQNMR